MSVSPESSTEQGGPLPSGGWSAHLDAVNAEPAASADERDVTLKRSVVGLGAICDLRLAATTEERAQSFAVSEFLLLDGGRRVMLHTDRGFTLSASIGAGDGGALREGETTSSLTQDVLNAVLPDDAEETGDDHPWSWLADLARDRDIDVTADELRELPYEVLFTDDVSRWIQS